MLSMFTRHTASHATTTNDHQITQYFMSKRMALHSALVICMASASLLSGCGGSDPTTRVSNTDTAAAVRTSYFATVTSPVLLTNVRARAIDTGTGNVLDQVIITSGTTAALSIPVAYIKTNNIIVLSIEPIDSSSTYYDPMLANGLGGTAKFNQSLHTLVSMNRIDTSYEVDPFSEIAYQRSLFRTGTYAMANPLLSRLTIDQINLANTETTESFGTGGSTVPYTADFSTPATIASQHIFKAVSIGTSTKTIVGSVQSYYFALSQLALYAQNNPSDASPYLNFAMRAALDLRDGDLDGMTTFGGDAAGTVNISSPILYSGIVSQVNNDPDHTDLPSLIALNAPQRNARGDALKVAANKYFDTINASLPVDSRMDTDTRSYLQSANYAIFANTVDISGIFGTITSLYTATKPIGAGNYTKAFGLPTGVDIKTSMDASDLSNRTNDIVQLAGIYQNTSGCQLSIGYDGSVQLTQGSQTYQAMISRDYADSMVRISGAQYRINIIAGDITSPSFIQILTNGAQILSAVEGRSTQLVPTNLDSIGLSCTFN